MHRNEAIKLIFKTLEEGRYVKASNKIIAKVVLDRLEEAGMAPPEVIHRTDCPGRSCGFFEYRNRSWEPEDKA